MITKLIKASGLFCILFSFSLSITTRAQEGKTWLYDTHHGQNARHSETFQSLLPQHSESTIQINAAKVSDTTLDGKDGLILFLPTMTFLEAEKHAIIRYLHAGGSLLLIFDEERRMSLQEVGVNDLITPFGMELTGDTPVRHNCGAIAALGEICKDSRELPYSGGRSIKGGHVISSVYDEGDYVHSAYTLLPSGGKIIVMSDGMAGLLLGSPNGVRFSGTGPTDSKYWGKDSRVFMQEILAFLMED